MIHKSTKVAPHELVSSLVFGVWQSSLVDQSVVPAV